MTDESPSRAERRTRSRQVILSAARALFAERGYERTSIRAVADRADVDPALVMQHFGSKDGLFAAAAQGSVPVEGLVGAGGGELTHALVRHVVDAFEDVDQRPAIEALMRSSLTHPAAGEVMRDQVMADVQAAVADTIGGPEAAVRAALLNATMLGVTISRYLLEVPALATADVEDLERILTPALEALIGPGGRSAGGRAHGVGRRV